MITETTEREQPTTLITLTKGVLLFHATWLLILLGFALDGITELGHHACFIVAGGIIGYGIRSLKD